MLPNLRASRRDFLKSFTIELQLLILHAEKKNLGVSSQSSVFKPGQVLSTCSGRRLWRKLSSLCQSRVTYIAVDWGFIAEFGESHLHYLELLLALV